MYGLPATKVTCNGQLQSILDTTTFLVHSSISVCVPELQINSAFLFSHLVQAGGGGVHILLLWAYILPFQGILEI